MSYSTPKSLFAVPDKGDLVFIYFRVTSYLHFEVCFKVIKCG